jgi:phosphatidate cytidylyltransferase
VSNTLQRVLFAVVAIPVALGIVWSGGMALALLVAVAAGLGTAELCALAAKGGVRPLRGLAVVLAVLAPLLTWMVTAPEGGGAFAFGLAGVELPRGLFGLPLWFVSQWPLAVGLVPVGVIAATLWRRRPGERPLEAAAVTLLAPLYCGFLPSSLLVIRYAADGKGPWPATWLVFFPLAVTWLCDSFAMWGGHLIGGPKLAPVVSPGKTRAGGLAGLAGGALCGALYPPVALGHGARVLPPWQWVMLGLGLAAVAQVGDLAESLFKREAGVKDSSHLIPGHGGVLDRLDSLYFVIPVAAILFRALGVI